MERVQQLKASIARRAHLPLASIRDDTELDTLPLESFALIELLIDIEQKHGVRLTTDDLRNLRTVRDLTERVAAAS